MRFLCRSLRPIGVVVALLAVGAPPAHAGGARVQPGRMVERAFGNEAGTRRFFLYVPSAGAAGRPFNARTPRYTHRPLRVQMSIRT